MKVEASIKGVRAAVKIAKKAGKTIGFVPTMGNLHDGHIKLVKEAKARCDYVVVSIFVNPTQFGENEDLSSYPRTLDADYAKLTDANCDMVFVPENTEMYVADPQISVTVGAMSKILCGVSRPDHFDGVVTVVSKLFNIVQPDLAIFGRKDYQQLAIIRALVAELNFDIDIIGIDIVREESGLALSSRNGYLSDSEKQTATLLSQCLIKTGHYLSKGTKSYDKLIEAAIKHLESKSFVVDYFEIRNPDLSEVTADSTEFVVLVAAKLGNTRLIDNMSFAITA